MYSSRSPTTSRRRRGVIMCYAAVLVWLLRDGYAMPFVGMAGIALAFICWASVRGRRRPAAVCFGASVIAANGAVAPLCVYHQGWGC
jgi:hypothetical protein